MNGRTALYRVYSRDGELLYIGISNRFGARWEHHALIQPWWPEAHTQTVEWLESRADAEAAEEAAIKAENPRFNVLHHPEHEPPARKRSMHPRDQLACARLRIFRQRAGMSQAALAAAMRDSGWRWHQATVQRIEAARRGLLFVEVMDAAAVLGVTHEDFADDTEDVAS